MRNNHDDVDVNLDFDFQAKPGWSAKRIRVGRFVFEDIEVNSREGNFNLNDTLRTAADKTRRVRGALSRYPELLPASAPARLLSVETADYLAELKRRGIESGTITCKKRVFRLLLIATGDIPVSDINAAHIQAFWDVVRWWPRSSKAKKVFEGMTDAQILEYGKQHNSPAPRTSTFNASRRDLAAFFNRLLRMRVIHHSPIEPFSDIKDDLIGPDARRPFTNEELIALFDPANFLPWARKYPHRWWGSILGLYTGARVNEVAQLKVADVIQVHGTWCIAIRKTVDADMAGNTRVRTRQRVKGKSSLRNIPIAQAVLDAGFLDYLSDAKASKHPRLFPHLSCGVNRKTGEPNGAGYGRGLSLEFSEYLHRVHDLPKGFAFHVFRHTIATELEAQGVSSELIATITGHVIKKTVPVLEAHYLHKASADLLSQQSGALALFNPPVQLPKYVKGQFARQLGPNAKMHP